MMTKDEFRALAQAAIDELCSIPDDLWEDFYAVHRTTMPDGSVVVVGIERDETSLGPGK